MNSSNPSADPITNADQAIEAAALKQWQWLLDANPSDVTSPEEYPDHALVNFDEFLAMVREIIPASLKDRVASPSDGAFQVRVAPWMLACFGPEISGDKVERGDRFLEEVFEQLQSGGYDPGRIVPLRDYVWSRPVGEPDQEAGGVMVTFAAYCLAFGLNMHEAGERELARIWTKVDVIREKQAAKPHHSPLPIAPDPAAGVTARKLLKRAAAERSYAARDFERGIWNGTIEVAVALDAIEAALRPQPDLRAACKALFQGSFIEVITGGEPEQWKAELVDRCNEIDRALSDGAAG